MPENEPFEMLVTAKQSIDLKYMSDISGRFNVKSSLILSISIHFYNVQAWKLMQH
jgi:hypothetical protein